MRVVVVHAHGEVRQVGLGRAQEAPPLGAGAAQRERMHDVPVQRGEDERRAALLEALEREVQQLADAARGRRCREMKRCARCARQRVQRTDRVGDVVDRDDVDGRSPAGGQDRVGAT
jgi:hypothetical protein